MIISNAIALLFLAVFVWMMLGIKVGMVIGARPRSRYHAYWQALIWPIPLTKYLNKMEGNR